MKASVFLIDNNARTSFLLLASSTAEDRDIQKSLHVAFDAIAANAFCGIQVPKRQIPKEYLAKFGIENLWKYNFHRNWRLMYSVAGDGKSIIALIIEWLPHKEYERRFGY